MASATYHHGNLRQALLEHAVDLARAGGPDALVLRDVQRAIGVSNSAAYRHYADRQALLTSVQIYGMTMLGEAMQESPARVANRGPRDRRALVSRSAVACPMPVEQPVIRTAFDTTAMPTKLAQRRPGRRSWGNAGRRSTPSAAGCRGRKRRVTPGEVASPAWT
jgi:AcrR family transcriptional regulator